MRRGKQKGSFSSVIKDTLPPPLKFAKTSLLVKMLIVTNVDLPSFVLSTPIPAFLADAVESLSTSVKVEDIT